MCFKKFLDNGIKKQIYFGTKKNRNCCRVFSSSTFAMNFLKTPSFNRMARLGGSRVVDIGTDVQISLQNSRHNI